MAFTTIISALELHGILDAPELLIIDARHDLMKPDAGAEAYAVAHIPQAHFMHLDKDLSGQKTGHNGRHPLPNLEQLSEKLRQMGMKNTTQVVVYDENNGMMAARAWWLLRHLGHAQVAVLNGGISTWIAQGLPVIASVPATSLGDFVSQRSLNKTVNADSLQAHLNDGTYLVVDARAPERFSGEVEPIDPVGGHIPHAKNHFFMRNLNADLTFKSASELRSEWQSTFGDTPIEKIVNQCGSGVTACHNMLAQEMAGFSGAALYAGSWSEWCSDSARPIEKGSH